MTWGNDNFNSRFYGGGVACFSTFKWLWMLALMPAVPASMSPTLSPTFQGEFTGNTNMTDIYNLKSAVYYVPGVIGTYPLHGTERALAPDIPIYTSAFEAIHDRDLNWLSQVTDTIRISGFVPYPYGEDSYFLDKAHSKGLRVIVSFSMRRYRYSSVAAEGTFRDVVDDFTDFIKNLNHPAVIAVCLGDVDDEWAEFEHTTPSSPIRPLLSSLIEISQKTLVGIPVTVEISWDDSEESNSLLVLLRSLDFDFWIFNVARSTGLRTTTSFASYPGGNRPCLLQISESAWNYKQHRTDDDQQTKFYARMLDFIGAQQDLPNRIIAPIFFEWVDQWWRMLEKSSCTNDAPYVHASCGTVKTYIANEASAFDAIEYNGLCSQFDMPFARHCISPRASLVYIANFSNRPIDFGITSIACAQTMLVSPISALILLIPMICILFVGIVIKVCGNSKTKKSPKVAKSNAKPKHMTFGLSPEHWELYYEAHYKVASDCVNLFIQQETEIIQREDSDEKPEKVLSDRLLHVYYEQHPGAQNFIDEQEPEDVIRACIIYRTIFSLGEQSAYCPTVINNAFHRILLGDYEIDLNQLQKGLDKLEEPKTFRFLCCFANKTNFDDKEDAAKLEINHTLPSRIPEKLVLKRNDRGIGKVEHTSLGAVKSSFLEFTSIFVLLDVLSHYRYILYIKIWIFASAYYFANVFAPGLRTQEIADFRSNWVAWGGFPAFFVFFDAYCRFGCEMIILICSFRRLLARQPHPPRTWMKRICTAGGTISPALTSAAVYFILDKPIEYLACFRVIEAFYLFLFRTFRNNQRNSKKKLWPWREAKWRALFMKKLLFWIAVFGITWFCEAFLVTAVVRNFTPYTVCTKTAQVCSEECLAVVNVMCSNKCMSCKAGVYTMYVVVFLGAMLDTHLVFNLVLTALGYVVGIQEKASAVYYDKIFDWSSCSTLLQKAFPEIGDENTDIRALWETVIQDLRNRHLISNQQTEKLKLRSDEPLAVRSLGLGAEAKDRLLFFYHTLKAVGQKKKLQSRNTVEPLTLSITTFDEHVLKPVAQLRRKQGEKTELEHLIENMPDEWKYACEQFRERGTLDDKSPDDILQMFISGRTDQRQYDWLEWEIQKWASYRQQTVARTIRGCTNYFAALQFLLDRRELTRSDGELLVAHQTYATIPRTGTSVDAALDWLDRIESVEKIFYEFREFSECMYLVYDYEYIFAQHECPYKPPKKEGQSKSLTELRVQQKYFALRRQFEAFLTANKPKYDFPCEKYSVLANVRNGKLCIVDVIPRQCKLRLENAQGKSANQLNMLRFATGHYIQVNDANMDLWLGEALKFPFTCSSFLNGKDRMPQYRIIGFREYVYTQFSGPTGNFMGQSEFVFGTIISRAMRFLGSRLHYGHPDFFDLMWAYATGGLSKASAGINTSEDIFAGFTILLRESGKKVHSSDMLEGQKGREEVFLPASGFLSKISSGFVAMQSSRDLYRLTDRLPLFGLLGLYFGSAGFYVANVVVDLSQYAFMLGFMFLALGSVSLHDVGALGSSLGSEWLITAAITALPPLLLELVLEYGMVAGFSKLLVGLISIRNSLMFFVFQNKVVSSSVMQAIVTGEAAWVNTGRPSFFQHYTKAKAYSTYALSTYTAGTELLIIYGIYIHFADAGGGTHPMYIPVAAAIMWLLTPAIFTPQLGAFQLLKDDIYESFHWLTADIAQPRAVYGNKDDRCFNSFWWGVNNRRSNAAVLISLLTACVANALMFSMVYSSFVETLFLYIPVLVMQCVTTVVWISLKGGPLYTTFYLGAPFISFGLIIFLAVPYSSGEWWIALLMLLLFASLCRNLILTFVIVGSIVFGSCSNCKRSRPKIPDFQKMVQEVKIEDDPKPLHEPPKKSQKRCIPFWQKDIWNINRFLFFASFQFHFKWGTALFIMFSQFGVNLAFLCCIFIWKQSQLLFTRKTAVVVQPVEIEAVTVVPPPEEVEEQASPRNPRQSFMQSSKRDNDLADQVMAAWWRGLHPRLHVSIYRFIMERQGVADRTFMKEFQLTMDYHEWAVRYFSVSEPSLLRKPSLLREPSKPPMGLASPRTPNRPFRSRTNSETIYETGIKSSIQVGANPIDLSLLHKLPIAAQLVQAQPQHIKDQLILGDSSFLELWARHVQDTQMASNPAYCTWTPVELHNLAKRISPPKEIEYKVSTPVKRSMPEFKISSSIKTSPKKDEGKISTPPMQKSSLVTFHSPTKPKPSAVSSTTPLLSSTSALSGMLPEILLPTISPNPIPTSPKLARRSIVAQTFQIESRRPGAS